MNLSFNEYQFQASKTAIYPEVSVSNYGECVRTTSFIYPALGLCGEAGEVAEKVKKIIRDDLGNVSDTKRQEIAKELGDCLWYIGALCQEFNLDMEKVAQANLDKLAARAAAGTIGGSGDNR